MLRIAPEPVQSDNDNKASSFRFINLKFFDVLGREVATLVEGELPAGEYSTSFNALDFSSGLYFYTLAMDDIAVTNKFVVVK